MIQDKAPALTIQTDNTTIEIEFDNIYEETERRQIAKEVLRSVSKRINARMENLTLHPGGYFGSVFYRADEAVLYRLQCNQNNTYHLKIIIGSFSSDYIQDEIENL